MVVGAEPLTKCLPVQTSGINVTLHAVHGTYEVTNYQPYLRWTNADTLPPVLLDQLQ